MKIVRFSAENFKRIQVVEIKPDGNLVRITGKNGSGKTSTLDAIWAALKGTRDFRQSKPVRKGTEVATIRLDLGEYVVTRTFRDKGDAGVTTTLKVENADGFRAPEAQSLLNSIVGPLSIDPLEFARMKPGEQHDTLRGFVPGFDFAAEDAKNKSDYAERTEINRDLKQAEVAAAAITVPDGLPDEPIDEDALTQEITGASAKNTEIERRRARRAEAQAEIDAGPDKIKEAEDETNQTIKAIRKRTDETVADLEAQIVALQRRIVDLRASGEAAENEAAALGMTNQKAIRDRIAALSDAMAKADPLPEPVDVEAIGARLTAARTVNAGIRDRQQRDAHAARAKALQAQSDALTAAMEARDKAKADAIAAAKIPVDNLTFGDGEILLDGLPFDQASDAARLRTSCAIAMALNPKLRVVRVRDGSLLDEDGLRLLAEMADAHDCQVWIEQVSADGKGGFLLEDGHLVDQTTPPRQGALV